MSPSRSEPRVTLRPASPADERFLFELRNDPDVRAQSFRSEPVAPAEHREWLARRLARATPGLFVVEAGGAAIGVCRLDLEPERVATVSLQLAAAARGRGYGTATLRALTERASADPQIDELRAFVLPGNEPSLGAFRRAGFDGPRWALASELGPPTGSWEFRLSLRGTAAGA